MRSTAGLPTQRSLAFGRFVLFPKQRQLLESGTSVPLGTRALDILTALVERAGDLVTKEALVASAWPDTVVHEGNLKVHIAAIRRALGDGRNNQRYVVNVAGRGYRFVAPVSTHEAAFEPAPPAQSTGATRPLIPVLTRVFGRAEAIESITGLLSEHRLVTIVGSGGIGKTTVAHAIFATVALADPPIFADLALLHDPLLLAGSLAPLLGLPVHSENPLPYLIRFLKDKQLLIVLDGCEHLLEAVAMLAESLLAEAPGLRLLATSREPLRAMEEVVRRLSPLEVPPEDAGLTAVEVCAFSAVELFVARARASSERFELTDADAADVSEICRRLDGNALAVELAAGRVDAFGIGGVAARLSDRFNLLKGGKRTALPRHQGLGATLDWSYGLLAENERAVLRRLSVFVGTFTLDAVGVVATDASTCAADVVYLVANLVAKSLVSSEFIGGRSRYRLLDTTSAYALEKLQAAGELDEYSQRHAQYLCELLERAGMELQNRDAFAWAASHGAQLDNIRKLLDWSLSKPERRALGVALTIAAVPLWLNLSLMDECQQRVRKALSHQFGADAPARQQQMRLFTALGVALYSIGSSSEAKSAWNQVLTHAEALHDSDFKLRALWGLWTVCVNTGEQREGLALAREFAQVAKDSGDTQAGLVSDRLVGISHHFLGEHAPARRHIERMLERSSAGTNMPSIARFQIDQAVASRAYLAKVLWIQGCPDQAVSGVERALSEARQVQHSLSICYCLGQSGCPIAFFNGDHARAERYVELLLEHSVKCRLALWSTMGRGFKAMLLIRRGNSDQGLPLLRESTEELRASSLAHLHSTFLGELARGLGDTGQATLGLDAIQAALARCTGNNEHWCLPELMRIQGELWLLEGAPGATERAEAGLLRALDLARKQEALSWQLRTALSLARLRPAKSRSDRYRELLQSVYSRFSEGFATADLLCAKRLLRGSGVSA